MEPFELSLTRVTRHPIEASIAGLNARESLAKSLEAVLISGLELIRKAIGGTPIDAGLARDEASDERARQFEADAPGHVRAAIARWYEGSFLLLEATRLGNGSTDIEDIGARLGIESGRAVSILADELFHELEPAGARMPVLDPALDPRAGLRWYCLCAVGTLEMALAVRGQQPILRGVVLDSWPGLVTESLRILACDPATDGTLMGSPIAQSHHTEIQGIDASRVHRGESRPDVGLLLDEVRVPSAAARALSGLGQLEGAFDQVRNAGPVPVALEPLLVRLKLPFTVLTSLDPGFLRDEQRSLRRLLEALCDAARLAPEQLAPQSALMQQLEIAVRAIEVMAQQAQTRAQVLHGQLDRELKRAAQGVSTVLARLERERDQLKQAAGDSNRRDLRRRPSRERELQVTDTVRGLLLRKIENRPLPGSVTDFLQEVWVRHLRTAVLRDGERSPQFHRALGVVDDLVWTLDTQRKDTSRSQLAKRIPGIVQTLSSGAQAVGLSDGEIQPFMDELFIAHLRRMQRSSARSEPEPDSNIGLVRAPVAVPLVRILREIPVDDCPPDARAVPVSQETIGRVQQGCWLELQSGGQLSRMKVAWMNPDRSVVLLVREGDRKAMSLRGRDLQERLLRQSAMLLV